MRNIFAVCVLFSTITFNCFSQDKDYYFVNDTWENAMKLAAEKKMNIVIYLYDENLKCKICDEINEKFTTDNELLSRVASKAVLFRVKNDDVKKFQKRYFIKKLKYPYLIFSNNSNNITGKAELKSNIIDLEKTINNQLKSLEDFLKVNEIYSKHYDNKNDYEASKNYYLSFLNCKCGIDVQEKLEEYLESIPITIQQADETLKIILSSDFIVGNKANEILLFNLREAVKTENLYYQYTIKDKIISSLIYEVSKRNIKSKKFIKTANIESDKLNSICPNFKNDSKDIFPLYYYGNAWSTDIFMRVAKEYYVQNIHKFNKIELIKQDSLLNIKINNFLGIDTLLTENERSILKAQSHFQTKTQVANLTYISRTIFIQQKFPARIDFGIECAKKAIELAPNATRYALYGLLYNKNEKYKTAQEYLVKAIELEADGKDKIDVSIAHTTMETYLKIKNMIPEE